MLFLDATCVMVAYILAYLLRFDGHIPTLQWINIKNTLPYVIPIKLSCFFMLGLYRGMWRYTSLTDLNNVVKASALSSILIIAIILFAHRFVGYPRSVFLIDMFLTFLLVGGIRVFIRLSLANNFSSFWFLKRNTHSHGTKLLIIGAGDAGEKVLREIQENSGLKMVPVAFLDDNKNKHGKAIHNVPILGTVDEIDRIPVDFDEILITIPTARGEEMRRVVSACERTGKRYRTVPVITELIEGTVSVKTIRDVTLEDLLGREEIHIDEEKIRQYLYNKRILVTGAGGSIGSELVRQICRYDPRHVALLEFSEFNLFQTEMECRQRFGHIPVTGYLTDIRNRDTVNSVFREFHPEVVFHAAAYKHVPIQEFHPREAVNNNVLGTKNLVEASMENGVERFVLVSTDKAVRPSNVMGATKRVAEMLVECMNGSSGTHFMAVRFGNVLGSSGSVVPIFQQQIARGGPVTVTHPEVTRYFMSISEAAQLILQTGAMGNGSEIFILDMGKPVRILDIARDLIRLHGFEPERDIPIQFTGLRPGEKLYEELITEGEGIIATAHENIHVLRGNTCNSKTLNGQIDELFAIANSNDTSAIKQKLKKIVPEYTPQF